MYILMIEHVHGSGVNNPVQCPFVRSVCIDELGVK